jgi:serine/threonine-protein kinase
LADVGLALRVDLRQPDPTIPADHVVSQDPEPGAILRRQRAVRVRVSEGQRDPAVPSVVGQSERTAETVMSQANVRIDGRAEIRTTRFPVGTIVAQDPPVETRSPSVTLLVNRGDSGLTFVMPDLIGTLGARVLDILRRRGLRVSVSAETPYPGLPPGVVVRHSPQGGFRVAYGDAVTLELSR